MNTVSGHSNLSEGSCTHISSDQIFFHSPPKHLTGGLPLPVIQDRSPIMPPIIHGSLPIIHGSQRKSRPRSLAQAEGRAVRQRSKRVRTGAKAKTAGSEQTPPSISEEGRDIQYPEQQAEAVATTLRRRTDLARPSAPMVADGPGRLDTHHSSKITTRR